MSKQLAKSTGIVGSMTFLSRILGFVRDMLVAQFFGASGQYDAFLIAFKLPNFFRSLLAEGAFAQSFVPLLAEYRDKRTHEETQQYINAVAGSLALVLVGVVGLGIAFAPGLVTLFAPGFEYGGDRFLLATEMTRITFPYLLFISLTAFAGGILNTYGKFAIPALTPTLLNISMIACIFLLASRVEQPITALAWGVFAGGILQLLFNLPFVMKAGFQLRMRVNFKDPGVRRLLRLMVPLTYGASILQVNLVISTMFASFLAVGSVSWLYYAERLMQFPLGIFGVALATVVLPFLSKEKARADNRVYGQILDWSLKTALIIALPASIALWLLATPMLTALFQYREFTALDVAMASKALVMYSIGLLAFILVKIFAAACYARQDMKGPVRIATVSLFVNIALNAILIHPLAHAGLALSTSLSALVTAALLFWRLKKHHHIILLDDWGLYTLRVVGANAVMVAILCGFNAYVGVWADHSTAFRLIYLTLAIVFGAGGYGLALLAMGVRPSHLLKPIQV
jgi:putative peptidoglycan lipid II flippase